MAPKRKRVTTYIAKPARKTFANASYVARVNRRNGYMADGMTQLVVSRRAARVVNPNLKEKKYLDTVFAEAAIGSGSAASLKVIDLAIVPQGNTANTRIGKKIRIRRVAVKGLLYQDGTGNSSASSLVRLSLVWDREPDKAALVPTVNGDIYLGGPTSLSNRDNAPRFKILKSQWFALPAWQSSALSEWSPDGTVQQTFDWYLDFSKKDMEVIWTKADTTGATAAKIKGNLLMCFDHDLTAAQAGTKLQYNARVDYDDQ